MRTTASISDQRSVLYQACRRQLGAFCRYEWPGFWLGPDTSHVRKAIWALEEVRHRRIRRLIFTFPPRHYKTTCIQRAVAHGIGNDPDRRFMYLSYNDDIARQKGGEVRNIIEGEKFRRVFPNVEIEPMVSAAGLWQIKGKRGGMRSTGIGGGITGMGATDIIVDDPFKDDEEADSVVMREKVWSWFWSTAYTRGEPDPVNACIVVVHTRWHEDDFIGRLLLASKDEDPLADDWTVINFPAEAEKDDVLGRPIGAPLLFTSEIYAKIRRQQGPRRYAALYQQRPAPEEGALFRAADFQPIQQHAPILARTYRYWDLALTKEKRGALEKKKDPDWSAGALVGLDTEGNLWVLDVIRIREEWPEVRREILKCAKADPPGTIVGVEDVAHQGAALQSLRRHPMFLKIPLIGIKPRGKKWSRYRAAAWAAHAREGKLRVLYGTWNDDFIHECLFFPNGAHDDQVDAVSGAAGLVLFTRGANRHGENDRPKTNTWAFLEAVEQAHLRAQGIDPEEGLGLDGIEDDDAEWL